MYTSEFVTWGRCGSIAKYMPNPSISKFLLNRVSRYCFSRALVVGLRRKENKNSQQGKFQLKEIRNFFVGNFVVKSEKMGLNILKYYVTIIELENKIRMSGDTQ